MTPTEAEGKGPEGSLNTQSELDPKSVVTFVYRGENPYMRVLARGLQARGIPTDVHELSVDRYNVYVQEIVKGYTDRNRPRDRDLIDNLMAADQEYKAQLIGPLVNSSQGIIVTDITTSKDVEKFTSDRSVNAYEAIARGQNFEQEFIGQLTPVIAQIKSEGKNPALLTHRIADHLPVIEEPNDEQRKQLTQAEREILNENKNMGWHGPEPEEMQFAAMVKKNFDIPVIANFYNRETQNILEILKERGLDPENTVLLVDHHIYNFSREEVKQTGFGEVPIVRICPCCLAKFGGDEEAIAGGRLQTLGFKLFPIQVEPNNEAIDNLMGMIEEKRAELASKEPEK